MKTIVGASIGECVHVAGVINFLRLAAGEGYKTEFLGPAVEVDELLAAVEETDADIVAVSYRLTPENGRRLLSQLKDRVDQLDLGEKQFIFGGTEAVAREARELGLFDAVFGGSATIEDVLRFLKGVPADDQAKAYPQTLVERVRFKSPFPLIRHHYGEPSLKKTIAGCNMIAESGLVDVISIGPDQAAQESFFRDDIRKKLGGAGGVPVRSPDDFRALYQHSRCGNFPLMRCYSGTQDVFKWAEMLMDTINNAWCAVPLTWYNVMDKRGPRSLRESMTDAKRLMAWHGQRGIPVECNEAHHWSLRDAHDTIAVVMAFLGAYNAKRAGVQHYVAQYMFNTPPGTSASMDVAKMFAKKELIQDLVDEDFVVFTQVRAGLASFPTDLNQAKGQLGYATFLGMALEPDIVHVVGYCEADHAAGVDDVVESCALARRVIESCVHGYPNLHSDPVIRERKEELKSEAHELLTAIRALGEQMSKPDPWADVDTLVRAVELGLLDAPHLQNSPPARGRLATRLIDGACRAVDPSTGQPLSEKQRLASLDGLHIEDMN